MRTVWEVWIMLVVTAVVVSICVKDPTANKQELDQELAYLRNEIQLMATRVQALESRPSLWVQTAPLSSVVLPRGTLMKMADGSLQLALGKDCR